MTKKILVLHTGGTISMQADESGAVRTSADNPMNHISNPLEDIEVHSLDFLNLPSPYIKPKHMLALYKKIKQEVGKKISWLTPWQPCLQCSRSDGTMKPL